jgi:hypothetical protein
MKNKKIAKANKIKTSKKNEDDDIEKFRKEIREPILDLN